MLEFATNAARSVLGLIDGAEHRVEQLVPGEGQVHEAVAALTGAAESLDRHVEAIEGLAESLPALTDAVTRLCDQLAAVLELAAPVEAAERKVSGFARLFRRRRHAAPTLGAARVAAAAALPTPPPSAPAGESGSAPR